MNHGATIPRPLNLHRSAWLQLADVLTASLSAAWKGWHEAQRLHAEQATLRQLDRRTRQDLGLYAEGDLRSDSITRHYDQVRW